MDSWLQIPPGFRPRRNAGLCVIMAMAALALIVSLGAAKPRVASTTAAAAPAD